MLSIDHGRFHSRLICLQPSRLAAAASAGLAELREYQQQRSGLLEKAEKKKAFFGDDTASKKGPLKPSYFWEECV